MVLRCLRIRVLVLCRFGLWSARKTMVHNSMILVLRVRCKTRFWKQELILGNGPFQFASGTNNASKTIKSVVQCLKIFFGTRE